MPRSIGVMGALCALVLLLATPAHAITDGDFDGEGHPHVGLLVFDFAGYPGWRCTGTLLTPTVMLTAGHCTDGATGGRVWFDSDEATIRAKGYPFGGYGAIEFAAVYTSPSYNPAAFFLNDVGVVILAEPYYAGTYGALPEADALNRLKTRRGQSNQTFTAVGYGLQLINPVFIERSLNRMYATPHLVQINVPGFTGDFSMMLSNNHATGGTCFGDSGGPNFVGDSNVIGGVTSFGINGNCAGTGGVYRMDREHDIEWVNSFITP